MYNRFCTKSDPEGYIEWKGDEYSLIAFIYFTDCLDLWGSKKTDMRMQPFYSEDPDDKEKGVKYTTLLLENFKVFGLNEKHWHITRVRRTRNEINDAIIGLCKRTNENRMNSKFKIMDSECRMAVLIYYFENYGSMSFKMDDWNENTIQMLNIIREIIKNNPEKFETIVKLSRSLLKRV
jgi:hypothetical protein